MTAVPLDLRHSIHVARQPIVDASGRLFGYELLYRAQAGDQSCISAGDMAASRMLTDALLDMGLDVITNGARAFINFTKALLLNDAARLLPADKVVIELREDILVDDDVIDMCHRLVADGYALALDDFDDGQGAGVLLPYVKFVKLDVLEVPRPKWEALARRVAAPGRRVVAERVETIDVAANARLAGCTLFQGYYFCRPATRTVRHVPARRLAYLHLFTALSRPDLTIADLEELVKRDASMTLRVLKSINSAAFAMQREITSVRQALVLLGVDQVRRWASVWAMAGVSDGTTPEMVAIALMRARSCEIVGDAWSGPEAGAELFILGLCSMLDAMLDQPMELAINGLQLRPALRDALLGQSNAPRSILDAVIAHERGEWDVAEAILRGMALPESLLRVAYADALSWARELSTTLAA